MKLNRETLEQAVQQGLLKPEQLDPLYQFLRQSEDPDTRFNLTNMLYYLGGFLAIGALSLFMNLGWEQFGGWGIVAITTLYGLGAVLLIRMFETRVLTLPAALGSVFLVILSPLFIYGLQLAMGWWEAGHEYNDYHRWIDPRWLWMELGTLLFTGLVFVRYRYPLLLLPLALTLWYLSMDLAQWVVDSELGLEQRSWYTLWFGLIMLAGAFVTDLYSSHRHDYAWWLYLAGVLAFWGGLTAQHSESELAKLGYCAINLVMMWLGVVLQRRVFTLFGALGVMFYVGHLVWTLFEDSWLFPILLTGLGLLIVYIGILWQRNEARLAHASMRYLPLKIRNLLAQRRN